MKKATTSNTQLAQQEAQALMMLVQGGKYKEASARSRKLIKKFPSNPFLYDVLSKSMIAQGDLSGAQRPLEKLLELQPGYADGEYNLALVYMNQNRPADSAALLEAVIEKGGGSADAFTNLGAAYFELEQFDLAIRNYEKALDKDPKYVPALRNIGAALRTLRRFDQSVEYLQKVPFLAPRFAPGHISLGITLSKLGQSEKAQKCFETALKLEPDNREALYEMGVIHSQNEDYEAAIACFEGVDTQEARVKVLELMHQQGDGKEDLIHRLNLLNSKEPKSLRAAAFSAFASNQYHIEDTHSFAPDPIGFVSIRNIRFHLEDQPDYLNRLMDEAEAANAVWENNTTRGGFQTHGNLFGQSQLFAELEGIIRREIEAFRNERKGEKCGLIRHFPKRFDMDGWHVKLMKAGFQKPHIHSRGWVSGVLYLKIPKNTKGNEGAIAFSLHGYDYRKEHDNIPMKEHMPEEGDLVLFPSSLFHHTIPFESDEDRQCIAFDVLPIW